MEREDRLQAISSVIALMRLLNSKLKILGVEMEHLNTSREALRFKIRVKKVIIPVKGSIETPLISSLTCNGSFVQIIEKPPI